MVEFTWQFDSKDPSNVYFCVNISLRTIIAAFFINVFLMSFLQCVGKIRFEGQKYITSLLVFLESLNL